MELNLATKDSLIVARGDGPLGVSPGLEIVRCGPYRSDDGGHTWHCLYRCYCRAAWWDPADAQHIIFGPADGVDRSGRLEESRDGGSTWQAAGRGFNAPWTRHMVERLYHIGDMLWAVLSNGDLFVAALDDLAWGLALQEAGWINDLAIMP